MSDVERIKRESNGLRGSIADSLEQGGSRFDEDDMQLLKFHGIYQQEDRDARQARKRAGLEPAYQFMLRTRLPGGMLTAQQYLVQDRLADMVGNGGLRLTTRQGIQLHGVLKGDLRRALAEIDRALLSTAGACGDVNRNVTACPAHPPSEGALQAVSFAKELAQHFKPRSGAYHEIWIDGERVRAADGSQEEADPIYGTSYLPRKFKMGVAIPPDNCIDVYTQDIGFVALIEHGRLAGYTLLVGGGLGMTHGKSSTHPRLATPLCFIDPANALALAQAILTVQRDFGDRTNRKHARFKYLVEERGTDWLRAQVEDRFGSALQAARPFVFTGVDDHLGWTAQHDGRYTLGISIENGRVIDRAPAAIRSGLRQAIARFAPSVRITAQQNVLLQDIAAENRAALEDLLAMYGVETDPQALGIARDAMACPALPTCGLALTDAERALPQIVSELQAEIEALGMRSERLSIRMTGCPNGCARPYMGDIGLVGRSRDLYDIFLGGDRANTQLNRCFKSGVHRGDLVAVISTLLRVWAAERTPGETFGDYCTRMGFDYLKIASRIPA